MTRILTITILFAQSALTYAQKKTAIPTEQLREWKTAGDESAGVFEKYQEYDLLGKTYDEGDKYNALYSMYNYYSQIDQAGKKIFNDSIRKQISSRLKNNHPYFKDGGSYFNELSDFSKAADFFEAYCNIPSMNISKKEKYKTKTPEFQKIKYYAAISAIKAEDHKRAIRLLQKINSEPFIANDFYEQSNVYEFLASEYEADGDKENYMKTLNTGGKKYPGSKYFYPSLINEYIKDDKLDDAVLWLDKIMKNKSANLCELSSVKAAIFASTKDYYKSTETYKLTLNKIPDCENALEGLAVVYILQAQDLKDNASRISDKEKQKLVVEESDNFYKQAYPLLEKLKSMQKDRDADKSALMGVLRKLQNVYYNLNMMNEFDVVDRELDNLRD